MILVIILVIPLFVRSFGHYRGGYRSSAGGLLGVARASAIKQAELHQCFSPTHPILALGYPFLPGEWDDEAEAARMRRLGSDKGLLGKRGTVVGAAAVDLGHRPQPRPGGRQRPAEPGEWGPLHRPAAAQRSRLLSRLRHRRLADPALPRGRGAAGLSGSDAAAALAALADRSICHALACRPDLLPHAFFGAGRQPGSTDLRGRPPLYRANRCPWVSASSTRWRRSPPLPRCCGISPAASRCRSAVSRSRSRATCSGWPCCTPASDR